jgi:hypothetical protein
MADIFVSLAWGNESWRYVPPPPHRPWWAELRRDAIA